MRLHGTVIFKKRLKHQCRDIQVCMQIFILRISPSTKSFFILFYTTHVGTKILIHVHEEEGNELQDKILKYLPSKIDKEEKKHDWIPNHWYPYILAYCLLIYLQFTASTDFLCYLSRN